jgi:SNF2 family DNA or RNA helicase
VINNQTGAFSLDGLQVANYTYFFESPVSPIDRNQAERRTRRQGQKHKTCFYYDPVVADTVDERILEFHKEGEDIFQALLVDPSKALRLPASKR